MVNICPWCNTSGYILCAWDSGLTAREQADAPKGAVGDDLPALSGALVVRSIPLYILRSPLSGGTTYKRGRADTTCGAAENPLLTAVFRRLSSRHHLVAVGRA